MTAAPSGPLVGYRVLELGSTIAGPVCARLFADFGADVIKIEPPEGDPGRSFGNAKDGVPLYASSMARNKRTLILDLKQAAARDIFLDLIARTDVLVENQRPGVLERLDLAYEVLAARNPRLVLVRISGYGQSGPYRERPGYGAICEAFAGVRHLTGDPDRPPARVAVPLTDYLTAVYAAFGAMMALLAREKSGRGQVVDAALYESAFSMMEEAVPSYAAAGIVPVRQGPRLMNAAPNSLYPTRDGAWVLIGANNDAIFARLAQAFGHREWASDPRYATFRARGERVDEVDGMVAEWTAARDSKDVIAVLEAAEVLNSRVYTIADIFADQHFRAREMLVKLAHPVIGEMTVTGVVPKLSATPGAIYRPGPPAGADTRAILSGDLGLADSQIAALEASGAVATHAKARA